MRNLSTRLDRLELSFNNANADPVHIANFVVAPNVDPAGYTCDGVNIAREPGESIEALRARCHDAVSWDDCNRKIFDIIDPQQHA